MPADSKIAKITPNLPPESKKLMEVMAAVREDVVKRKILTLCTAEQSADYLLTFADPAPAIKVKGFCYYVLEQSLHINSAPTIRYSEDKDGFFQPLKKTLRKNLDVVSAHLKTLGITIDKCEQTISAAIHSTHDGFYKIIFFSYTKKLAYNSDDEQHGTAFELVTPDNKRFHMIGLRPGVLEKEANFIFFHELGHVFGLQHFPPNFGDFKAICIAEFYNKVELVREVMKRNLCRIDSPSLNEMPSVMFCTFSPFSGTISVLPPGDAIAFKKQYDKWFESRTIGTKKTAAVVSKQSHPRPVKTELMLKSVNPQSVLSSLQPKSSSLWHARTFMRCIASCLNDTTSFLSSQEVVAGLTYVAQSMVVSYLSSYVAGLLPSPTTLNFDALPASAATNSSALVCSVPSYRF